MLDILHVYIVNKGDEYVVKSGERVISRHDNFDAAEKAALKFRKEEKKRLTKNK